MQAETLFKQGKLEEAILALNAHLRDQPGDVRARTFLFELLCFNGELDRADKQLQVLGAGTKEAAVGALVYGGALNAERTRREMFERHQTPAVPETDSAPLAGSLNGRPFASLSDADPRLGPRLEVFAAGDYLWIPFQHIAVLEMQPPRRLRDLLWAPARLITGPAFQDRDLGEVLLPVLSPLTFQHPDAEVRLGRVSEWCADEQGRQMLLGQKMLLVDGEEFPFLEIRRLESHAVSSSLGAHATQG